MTEEPSPSRTRRIRPWLAGLLTFVGPGLGLYYARRTHLAMLWAALSVVAGMVAAGGLFVWVAATKAVPPEMFDREGLSTINLIELALTALLALWVWRVATENKRVEAGGALRLFGYFLIWFIPLAASLAVAMALRIGWVQPFRIPSGAMQPTLHVGDYILVSKRSYGYSRFSAVPFEKLLPSGRILARIPRRGDIVVFRPPLEPDRDFVKRLIGLPGDHIQMVDGILRLNGVAVPRDALGEVDISNDFETVRVQMYRERLPNGVSYDTLDRGQSELDNTREFVVPEGSYFFMGDDRDNSDDSRRSVGNVPFDNLIGRVERIIAGPNSEHVGRVSRP